MPLIFVLAVSMIWEGVEEFWRFKSDTEINWTPSEVLVDGKNFTKIYSSKLKPGDIIKVYED